MLDQLQKTFAFFRRNTYKVGSTVPEDGFYVCAPCENKKYFKAGVRFPSCSMCLGKERRLFRKGSEFWGKADKGRKNNQLLKIIMENKNKNSNACAACVCPCEKHKEHDHETEFQKNADNKGGGNVCGVCGSNDKKCACN